jgi:multidrug resistance protein
MGSNVSRRALYSQFAPCDRCSASWLKLRSFNIASIGWVVGFASSIDSAALKQAAEEFGVSEVAESLATGLFLIGFGSGALFAGPISETVGRNPVYIITLSIYMVFIMASGLAPNIGAQLAFRFLAGFFGSTPLTCAGGSISDLWSPMERVYAFPVFATAAFMGPIFGPIVGGFIGQSSHISWRWTEWVTLIISGAVLILVVFFQPETYAPILLKWKANHLRKLTGDERYRAEVEVRDETFMHRLGHSLYRPLLLTAREPIIMLVALYLIVIYIILFTFLDGYTFIFTETYGFSQGLTGLAFIGIGIGLFCACLLVPLVYVRAHRDLKKVQEQGGTRLAPEFRLWYAMIGAPAIPASVLIMAWTSYPHISYWVPLAASVLFGFGILCVFISCYQYIIDGYEAYSASALASVTLIRYVAAGGMVEVAIPMYKNLGVHWTLTILGCISVLLVPIPYAFFRFGPKIRAKSKYAIA